MSYPISPINVPNRSPGQVISASHFNVLGDEVEALEAGLISAYGQTTAPIRLRAAGISLEWGNTTAGLGSCLAAQAPPTPYGYIGFHCQPGTTANTVKTTAGFGGALLRTNGNGDLEVAVAPLVSTDNQVPTVVATFGNNGVCTSANRPRFSGYLNASTSIANNTMTEMPIDTEIEDVGNWHSGASSRAVVPAGADGQYLVLASCSWAANATGYRLIGIVVRGGTEVRRNVVIPGSALNTTEQVYWIGSLVAGDNVWANITQTSGASLNIGGLGVFYAPTLQIVRLH